MKKTIIILSLTLFATTIIKAGSTNVLSVKIKGIRNTSGNISIGLYSNSKSFPNSKKRFRNAYFKTSKESMTHTFTKVPNGIYAVAIYHDANSNKKLDKNFIGKPKEGYGFSNNVFGTFGPPKFKDASFLIKGNKKIEIKLKY